MVSSFLHLAFCDHVVGQLVNAISKLKNLKNTRRLLPDNA